MGKGAETPTKAEAGKLKRAVCVAETVRFLFRAPRADCPAELVRAAPARVGKREFPQAWRADFVRQESGELSPRESGDGQFRSTWNVLRGTLKSTVPHVGFPGSPAGHKDSSVLYFM